MSGIYIHIPFCKTRCIYCDFFTNTRLERKDAYITALCKEIASRKEYLQGEEIRTLYFGGGTPSQLSDKDFDIIFNTLQTHFDLSKCGEITLEANPDDLTYDYINMLRRFPFNRISMGVQSFNDSELKFLNRRHDAQRAIDAIHNCQKAGFDNISIDLMYGLPNQTEAIWQKNLDIATSLGIQHISSYHLIYEEGTNLYNRLQSGAVNPVNEELSLTMFQMLIDSLKKAGFIHYEISNFGLEGYFSQHNSSYWTGDKYLGLGPGAHSYNGENRSYNIGDLSLYIKGELFTEEETLDLQARYNDFILTSLRTMWGVSLAQLSQRFNERIYDYCLKMAKPHLDNGNLIITEGSLKLTSSGIFISDGIMADLMLVD